jgi:hypothetical protein
MLMKHINQTPRPLRELRPDLPAGLIHGIERAMAKQPDQRWPDAIAFRDALTNDAAAPAPTAQRAPEIPRPNQAPRPDAAWPAQTPAMHRAVRDIAPQPAQSDGASRGPGMVRHWCAAGQRIYAANSALDARVLA